MKILLTKLLCGLAIFISGQSLLQAHPLAPGLWAITELPAAANESAADGVQTLYQVSWKTSLKPVPGVTPEPRLPAVCQPLSAPQSRIEGSGKIRSWQVRCNWADIRGQSFFVEGLKGSPVGVLLRIATQSGAHYHRLLSAEQRQFTVPAVQTSAAIFTEYAFTGFNHLIAGIDHVLFVLVLALLLGWGSRLIWAITFFTLGHSLTLALTVFSVVNFPSMLVEALIALTIALAAVELLRRDERRLFQRRPGWVSGLFGLLHGMGFAGALAEVGLPAGEIPLALLAFNVGIEVGQIAVIAAFLLLSKAASCVIQFPTSLRWVPAYSIGAVSAMWFWQRLGAEQFLV